MIITQPGWLRYETNEHGVQSSVHLCEHCRAEYKVTPAFPPEETREVSRTCTRPSCPSYRPSLDLDLVMFGITQDHDGSEKPGAAEYLASIAGAPRATIVKLPAYVGEDGN